MSYHNLITKPPVNEKMNFTRNEAKQEQQVHCIDLQESSSIKAVHFSPYEWSQDVILIVLDDVIIVGQVCVQDDILLEKLRVIDYTPSTVCSAISLSPETATASLPIEIQFCTADTNCFNLQVFSVTSAGSDAPDFQALKGHRSFVNAISYDPENNFIASVSDDRTCRLWSIHDDYDNVATFLLSSAGVATCWHREDTSKLLVAEKCGVMRFYNVHTKRAIMSVDVNKTLYDAHWAPSDAQLLASLQLGQLVLWDVTKPSNPKQMRLFTQHGGALRFSPLGELVAAVNQLEGCVKVIHIPTLQERLTASTRLASNVTWHCRLPIVCVGDDRKICFWKVKSK